MVNGGFEEMNFRVRLGDVSLAIIEFSSLVRLTRHSRFTIASPSPLTFRRHSLTNA